MLKDPERVERIKAIAAELVMARADNGEIDKEDSEALKLATRQAVREAKHEYDAPLQYRN